MAQRILIVEDDEDLRVALADNLQEEGYTVEAALSVEGARQSVRRHVPDLVLLDIMLPDGDGYAFCRELRQSESMPILMLTARSLEDDLVRGFEAGADDYVTKPYRLRELLVRVRALLRRRAAASDDEPFVLGTVRVDTGARTAIDADGCEVDLTPTEFDLVVFLYRERGRALARSRILDEVWGRDVIVDGRTVDNFVSSLRRKLHWTKQSPFEIRTVRGVGYRMEISE